MTAFETTIFALLCTAIVVSACIMRGYAHRDKTSKAFLMLVVVLIAQLGIVGLFTKFHGIF